MLDRLRADRQRSCDLRVFLALDQKPEDLELTPAQIDIGVRAMSSGRGKPGPAEAVQHDGGRARRERRLAASGGLNGANEVVGGRVLDQVSAGTCSDGIDDDLVAGVPREDQD